MATEDEVAFDPTTAKLSSKPSSKPTSFDPSTARPKGDSAHPRLDYPGLYPRKSPSDVDYQTGLPLSVRTALDQADNAREKKKVLVDTFGAANVKENPEGGFIVMRNGKKIAAEGGSTTTGAVASLIGHGTETLGMAAGAAQGARAGAPFGPWGIALGTVGGAILGSLTGKSLTEAQKTAQGRVDKTPSETAEAYARSAEGGVVGELGGQATGKVLSRVARGPLPKGITEVTPEVAAMNERLLAGGARPPAQSVMPGLKHVQWMETFAEKIGARSVAAKAANEAYVQKRVSTILSGAKVPSPEIKPTIQELARGDSKIPTAEVGEVVKNSMIAHKEMIEGQVRQQLGEVNKLLDRQMNRLATLTRSRQTDGLGLDAAQAIRESRRDFGTAMSKGYQKVDSLVGNEPLVPTMIVNKEARAIVNRAPKSTQQALVKEMSDLGIEMTDDPSRSVKKISFGDAQSVRTRLRERADSQNLTPGVDQGQFAHLANMMDHSIQAAGKTQRAAPAVRLLNQLDATYAKGIRRFEDATVKSLVNNLRAGITPDPETIARQILKPGNEARVAAIRQMVGPDTWKKVVGADYTNLISAATDDTGAVSGVKLLHQVTLRKGLMERIYGPRIAADVTGLARAMAARDSGLPIESLAPGVVRDTLAQVRTEEAQLNDFMKKNALSSLSNPKLNPERAYGWLVKPNNGTALKSAVKMLGEDSPQVTQLRQTALKELLAQAKVATASGRAPQGLEEALNKYTKEQQQLLFPHGMADDLNLLGKEIKLTMGKLQDESMASIGAGVVLSPHTTAVVRLPIQGAMWLYTTILSQPGTLRYLSIGLRSPSGPVRIATREMIKQMVRTGGIEAQQDNDQP
jgi:hypothetical protein